MALAYVELLPSFFFPFISLELVSVCSYLRGGFRDQGLSSLAVLLFPDEEGVLSNVKISYCLGLGFP